MSGPQERRKLLKGNSGGRSKHTSACYKRNDEYTCCYYCPTGGLTPHLERLLYICNQFSMSPERMQVLQEARAALRKWKKD